jgi:hypothetical protein
MIRRPRWLAPVMLACSALVPGLGHSPSLVLLLLYYICSILYPWSLAASSFFHFDKSHSQQHLARLGVCFGRYFIPVVTFLSACAVHAMAVSVVVKEKTKTVPSLAKIECVLALPILVQVC